MSLSPSSPLVARTGGNFSERRVKQRGARPWKPALLSAGFCPRLPAPKSSARRRNTSDFARRVVGVEPNNGRCVELLRGQRLARLAQLPADERAFDRQILGAFAHDPAHDVEPVRSAASMRKPGSGRVFRAESPRNRRGVRQGGSSDQIEARAPLPGKQIALAFIPQSA